MIEIDAKELIRECKKDASPKIVERFLHDKSGIPHVYVEWYEKGKKNWTMKECMPESEWRKQNEN